MTRTIATRVPAFAYLGQTLEFRKTWPDFPVATWSAVMHLRSTEGYLDIAAIVVDGDFKFTVAALAPNTGGNFSGAVDYIIVVTDGTDKIPAEQGQIDIKADPTAANALDMRSHVKKVLDAIEAVIEDRATKTDLNYTVSTNGGTRSLSRITHDELLQVRRQYARLYRAELAKQKRRSGRKAGNVVKSRISRAG